MRTSSLLHTLNVLLLNFCSLPVAEPFIFKPVKNRPCFPPRPMLTVAAKANNNRPNICNISTGRSKCKTRTISERDGKGSSSRSTLGGSTRRLALTGIVRRISSLAAVLSAMLPFTIPQNSDAACLTGDTSKECIGVYKLPLDDKALPYIETPEKLAQYAPDIKWVPPVQYPKNYGDAITELRSMHGRSAGLKDVVLKGLLEEAGIQMLEIAPRVTVSGRVVVGALLDGADLERGATASAAARRQEVVGFSGQVADFAFSELLALFGECDILIGQGLRGELGALPTAQLQILSTLEEVNAKFDELLKAIPETFRTDTAPDRRKLNERFHLA